MDRINTVGDLIARLEDYPADATIRVAMQPSWPLATSVLNVTSAKEIAEERDPDDRDRDEDETDGEPANEVWLATGSGTEYAPRGAWGGS